MLGFRCHMKTESKLVQEHLREAVVRHRADFWNFGKDEGENFIRSKTTQGELTTQIDPVTKKIRHTWNR